MPDPAWLAYTFAALMIAVSLYCLGRAFLSGRLARRSHSDVDAAHGLMGFAMVGMLVPDWNVLPVGLWEAVFAMMALYFLYFTVRHVASNGLWAAARPDHVAHPLIHGVMACTMLYMYWLRMPTSSSYHIAGTSMSGAATAGDPLLTLFLVVVLLGSAIRQLDTIGRVSRPRLGALSAVAAGSTSTDEVERGRREPSEDRGEELPFVQRLEVPCHIAMCVTMAYMLVLVV